MAYFGSEISDIDTPKLNNNEFLPNFSNLDPFFHNRVKFDPLLVKDQ